MYKDEEIRALRELNFKLNGGWSAVICMLLSKLIKLTIIVSAFWLAYKLIV